MLAQAVTNRWVIVFLVLVFAVLVVTLVLAGAELWSRWRDKPRRDG